MPFFSVIIPTYNRREALRRCLEALAAQQEVPGGFEVIVVVDGSTDGTAEMLASLALPFALIVLQRENGGASQARNAGAGEAKGVFLAFTEDDVIPAGNWLQRAHHHLAGGAHACLEGRTVYAGSGASVRRYEPSGIPSFIPCNLFIRTDAFRLTGGYETAFFDRSRGLYFREDADLGFRLLDDGFSVYIADDVIVSHPVQFDTLRAAIHHARRYRFDPLLYHRHPRRYRAFIEVKQIAGLRIHRPQHRVALAALGSLLVLLAGAVVGNIAAAAGGTAGLLAAGALFRFKYQGRKALVPRDLWRTPAFIAVPFVYLWSLGAGCWRYRSIGTLW